MILDKFRNRYSFNFLSVCGWIIFFLLCLFFIFIAQSKDGLSFIPVFVGIIFVFGLNIIFYLITFLVYLFEIVSLKKITNEEFLNNNYVKIFQTLGIVFAFLPLIIFLFTEIK